MKKKRRRKKKERLADGRSRLIIIYIILHLRHSEDVTKKN